MTEAHTIVSHSCVVCGSDRVHMMTAQKTLRYLCCAACRHCEKLPEGESARADFETSQAEYYEDANVDPFGEPHCIEREKMATRASVAEALLRPDADVLEIGPGGGTFLAWLRDKNYRATAAEHSPVIAGRLRDQGFDVIEGEFEHAALEKQFDAVFSFHIIEHVVDPAAHLSRAYALTRPGGVFVVATPNSTSLQQRLAPPLSVNFDAAHLRVFSADSLKRLSRNAGWTVERVFTAENPSGWLRFASKLVRAARKEDESATAGKYARMSAGDNKAEKVLDGFSLLTLPFRRLQAMAGVGSEIMLVLRKPRQDVAR